MMESPENVSQNPADEDLMLSSAGGNREAFADLIRRHQDALLNFFRRMGACSQEEDLVQETFVRLFRYRARYRATAKFTTFLYTIARHTWADLWRREQRRTALATQLKTVGPDTDQESMGRAAARLDIDAVLGVLPEKLRDVVVLSLYQGLRYEEIGAVLGIPVGTVKSRMFLALSRLKEVVDHESTRSGQ